MQRCERPDVGEHAQGRQWANTGQRNGQWWRRRRGWGRRGRERIRRHHVFGFLYAQLSTSFVVMLTVTDSATGAILAQRSMRMTTPDLKAGA